MSGFLKFVGFLGVLFVLRAAPSRAAVEYSVTYLGEFSPVAINNLGDVVGSGSLNGDYCGFLYGDGKLTALPALGGKYADPHDVNDHGDVVGSIYISPGESHPFLYRDGVMTDLSGSLGTNSTIDAINNSGQMAVNCYNSQGAGRAFFYDQGSLVDLGDVGGDTVAHAINSHGDIVVSSNTADGVSRAYVWRNGAMTDLGSLNGKNTYVSSINDAGQIVGAFSFSMGSVHAFLYENGNMRDITGPYDYMIPYAINNSGEIVGSGLDSNRGFIYRNGEIAALNDLIDPVLQVRLSSGWGINDNGQILAGGYSTSGDGLDGAYLLTPVPEPSSWLMLLAGVLVMACYSAKRTRRECRR
jgi:probable HAF family extracellular repeat protein